MTPRTGSLCTGYGGLDMAVQEVFGGTLAWVADIEPGACQILARIHPDVPNLGDISAVQYADVEPVDILTAGFPCQDLSLAGLRAGLVEGTRSGLWLQVARAIRELRPALVVIENVRGLLSADGHGHVEPCTWCVGDERDEPVLRALGVVLADLAELGFDAEWVGLPASSVGAPHERFRVFLLAWPAGRGTAAADAAASDERWGRSAGPRLEGPAGDRGTEPGHGAGSPADTDGFGGHGRSARAGQAGRQVPAGHAAADTDRDALRQQPVLKPERGGASVAGLPGIQTPADADGRGLPRHPERDGGPQLGEPERAPGLDTDRRDVQWGVYEPAIRRWEHVLGRPAPSPVDALGRLNPPFVEWMQGLPAGHVTDTPGLSRTAQLKALGNGVVPAQATAALRLLIARLQQERAVA